MKNRNENPIDVLDVINDAAKAFSDVLPKAPRRNKFMMIKTLRKNISEGVEFWGVKHDGRLVGVIGIQSVGEAAVFRHAYVRTKCQGQGFGSRLLAYVMTFSILPCLACTCKDAPRAVDFYRKHGFEPVTDEAYKERLLGERLQMTPGQVDASVLMADERWFKRSSARKG